MSLVLPDLPTGITYGTITGTFLSVLADSADAGNSPDATALGGTVTIAPVLRNFRITGSSPATVVTQDIKALIVNGALLGPDGVTPLRVMASDSPNLSPSPVQYTAKFALAGVSNQPPTVTFSVPSNGTVDLSAVISYPPVAPVVTIVSESTRDAAEAAAVRAEAATSVITRSSGEALLRAQNAPKIVVPPATLALYGQVGLSAWYWEFSSIGNRFALDTPTAFASVALPAGGTGNFELAIYSTSKDSTGSAFSHARVATSGLVPLSDYTPDGQNQIIVHFQDTPVLPPGEYTLVLWCDSNTPQFAHALNNDLKIARLGLGSIYDTTGLPEFINGDEPSGRAFIAALLPVDRPAAGTAVLMGDSITNAQTWFTTANYRVDRQWTAVNQGNPGEVTAQMVARFGDALAANPKLVVIYGGANDVGQGIDPQTTIANLANMRDQALAAGARVIMATVTPRGFLAGDADPAVGNAAIATINAWLRNQAVANVSLADWHDAMTTGDGVTYNPVYFNDHVHPSVRGQRIMASFLAPLL